MFLQKTTSWVLLIFCVPIVIFLSNEGLAQKPHRVSSRIVTSFPSPGPSPQELAWDGQFLWVVDDSTDLSYKLDPSNGNVLLSFSSPESEPRGLTWDGAHLWLSDNQATKIYKFDVSGPSVDTPISSIDAPVINLGKRGHSPIGGLAWDGEYLWCGNIAGMSSRMNRINPTNGRVTKFYFTYGYPKALAANSRFLWNATDNAGHRLGIIYKYDISNGLYIEHFDTPGYYPTGLAIDGQYLWCSDKAKKRIYKIAVE